MGTIVRVPFEVTGWEPEPEPLELGEAGPVESPVGYAAIELVTGTLDGRSGTFVLQHTGVVDDGAPLASGVVLPGTGTGVASLQGPAPSVRGVGGREVLSITLDYELP